MDRKIDFNEIYEQYYVQQPKGMAEYESIKLLLASLETETLYDFLDVKQGTLAYDGLYQKAIEKKRKATKEQIKESAKIIEICEICFSVFETEERHEEYDDYEKRKAILDEVAHMAERAENKLTSEQCTEYIRSLVDLFRDNKLATELFMAFCKVKNITYSIESQKETEKRKKEEVEAHLKATIEARINELSRVREHNSKFQKWISTGSYSIAGLKTDGIGMANAILRGGKASLLFLLVVIIQLV